MPLNASRIKPRLPPKAMYFDGTDDYVDIAESSSLQSLNYGFTFEVLFRAEEIGTIQCFITDWDYYARMVWFGLNNDGRLKATLIKNDTAYPTIFDTYIESNKFYVAHLIYNGTKYYLYINSVKESTETSLSAPIDNPEADWSIARRRDNRDFFNGSIGFVRIYSRALSESEIQYNYLHPSDPVRDGLVLWLHWDSIDSDSGLWRDKTYHGNDGTIYGATEKVFTPAPYRKLTPVRKQSILR